ncbi:MAG: chitobiase/beta-hexosaminidase C-terminal domain-containing protein [Clostridia bacterium]|nr:chitobiase/beta-hexosaminidase C-terminal domain-containing protein [Clostridia bacterium]
MICERCGTQSDNGARICPHCGAPLHAYTGTGSVADMRQGRSHEPPPVYGSKNDRPSRESRYRKGGDWPENRRGVSGAEEGQDKPRVRSHDLPPRKVTRRGVNRAMLITVLLALLLVAAVAAFVLAIRLPQGHLLLLRATADDPDRQERVISLIGEEEAARALWIIGQEQIDQGYIMRCIETYNQAYDLDPDIDGLYERLLSLADAYEAIGQLDEAERVYRQLYSQVDAANPLAYRFAIDIMMDQGRLFEATDLMQTAYANTGELSFKSQREQRVPLPPTSDPDSGRYMQECRVTLSSPQGYDVYYLLDDAESELPEKGILFNEPIVLGEGTYDIRAVSVSSELISDEVSLRYTVWFPTPSAPKSRLLTGVYDKPRRVYLYMEDIKITGDTPNQQYTIYYTIDGTAPNIDSPIYTDEGFMLPVGDTTLRAVAVNQYGKVSNEYVGTYKVNGSNYARVFQDSKHQFKAFTLGETTYDQFVKLYGAGAEALIDSPDTYSGKAIRLTYDWGTACFTDVGRILFSVSTNNPAMVGPAGSKVGMKTSEVTALFRDRGQAANAKGNRSLYFNESAGYGRYWKDSETTAHLEYVSYRENNAITSLIYEIENDVVTRINMTLSGEAIE